jgi:hypothetical protein
VSDRYRFLRANLSKQAMDVRYLIAERDELLAALTELVAAYKQVAEGSGDDGADMCRYERAMGAAERLIANTGGQP